MIEMCDWYTTTGWPCFRPKCSLGWVACLGCHDKFNTCPFYCPSDATFEQAAQSFYKSAKVDFSSQKISPEGGNQMEIVLTSFRDAKNWPGTKYSIARFQPYDMHYMKFPLPVAPILDGRPLRHLTPEQYKPLYESILNTYESLLVRYFAESNEKQLVLLCWCNPDRQKGHNKLYCHRILLGYWIEKHFPNFSVIYADGAENPVWQKDFPA